MTKKITFSLLAIGISGCVLLSAGLIVAAVYLLKAEKNYVAPTVEAAEELTIDEQMDQIQKQVSAMRGLEMNTPLDRAMMTTDELKDVVINEFFVDYTTEDAQNDVDVLSAFGLLEPDFDLLQFYKDLYSEQIAGYYDSETKEMNVISDGVFGGVERMTYAHEFTHVLQDQNYDLENSLMLNEDYCENESEYCTAVTALIEGDAVLSEQYWFLTKSTDQDKADVSDFQASYESPVYDSAPYFMQQDFLFSYQQGFTFVNQLYGENKWRSVDEAYQNPPVSTEQILHPEKYPHEKPVAVEMPKLVISLGNDWTEIDRNTLGEWYSYLVLSAGIDPQYRLDPAEAETATAGWGGDVYVYCTDDMNGYVFAWLSTWDTSSDAEEFFYSSSSYGDLRWGVPSDATTDAINWDLENGSAVTMKRLGSDVLWLMSNDPSAFDKALSAIQAIEY